MTENIEKLFEEILNSPNKKWDELFLSAHVKTQRGLSLFEGKRDAVDLSHDIKIGVWASHAGRFGSSSLEQASAPALNQAIGQALEAAVFSDPDPDFILAPAMASFQASPLSFNFSQVGLNQLEQYCLQAEEAAKGESSLVVNIPHVSGSVFTGTRILANSKGLRATENHGLIGLSLSVLAKGKDGRMVNCYRGLHSLGFLKTGADFGKEVAKEAIARVEPRGVATGAYPIVFDPNTSAHLLSSFSSVFSGELLYRKLARLEGRLGEKIANGGVSILDSAQKGLAPHGVDGEGSPAQEKFLIEGGIFKKFLQNLYTGRKNNSPTTANADGGLGSAPTVSHANISWEGKITPRNQLMAGLKKGILVCELNGASASPVSGDFSYGALGYWVEDGKISHPIADFTVAGNFFDLLPAIEAVGDDLEYFSPTLLGSTGGRSLLVRELSVSGK